MLTELYMEQSIYRPTSELIAHFVCTLFTFVGIGLMASSVIKYPTDPSKFLILGTTGALIFFLSSLAEEFIVSRQKLFRHGIWKRVFGTFIFSAGIAMISASIQDFEHIPHRTVLTVPLAIVAATTGFLLKRIDEHDPKCLAQLVLFGVVVSVCAWGLVYGLIYFR